MMKFLVDECVGCAVADWLVKMGYDAVVVGNVMAGATDNQVLAFSYKQGRILITSDKDFGDTIFKHATQHVGIVLLRLNDERSASKITALERLLQQHGQELENNFVVITEMMARIISR